MHTLADISYGKAGPGRHAGASNPASHGVSKTKKRPSGVRKIYGAECGRPAAGKAIIVIAGTTAEPEPPSGETSVVGVNPE